MEPDPIGGTAPALLLDAHRSNGRTHLIQDEAYAGSLDRDADVARHRFALRGPHLQRDMRMQPVAPLSLHDSITDLKRIINDQAMASGPKEQLRY